jgi:hypothetical protein
MKIRPFTFSLLISIAISANLTSCGSQTVTPYPTITPYPPPVFTPVVWSPIGGGADAICPDGTDIVVVVLQEQADCTWKDIGEACLPAGAHPNFPYWPEGHYYKNSETIDGDLIHTCLAGDTAIIDEYGFPMCTPPGTLQFQCPATPVPLTFNHMALAGPNEVNKYCADAKKKLGAVVLAVPVQYNMTVVAGPVVSQAKKTDTAGLDNDYTFIGSAGAKITVKECSIPAGGNPNSIQTNQALCLAFDATLGNCTHSANGGGGGGGSGGGSCQPPSGGCPSGSFWQGSPSCYCAVMK